MNTKILLPYQDSSDSMSFAVWFAQACTRAGFPQTQSKAPLIAKKVAAQLHLSYRIINKGRIIVPSGVWPDVEIWPLSFYNELIPMIWDAWPSYWPRIISSFRRHKVKCCFFTASQVCEKFKKNFPNISFYHIPEGIRTDLYDEGTLLENRTCDILELGRSKTLYHTKLMQSEVPMQYNYMYPQGDALYRKPLFPTMNDLVKGFANSKITFCAPRNDTHPHQTGGIETLTQRYWECMLSRTLIVGKAPQELIDLIGYNPVVTADINNLPDQLDEILSNIKNYQDIVDKNRKTALEKGSWDVRMPLVKKALIEVYGTC